MTHLPPAEQKPPVNSKQIDEHWMAEWVALGFKEIEASLAKHTAFEEYLKHKEQHGHHADSE